MNPTLKRKKERKKEKPSEENKTNNWQATLAALTVPMAINCLSPSASMGFWISPAWMGRSHVIQHTSLNYRRCCCSRQLQEARDCDRGNWAEKKQGLHALTRLNFVASVTVADKCAVRSDAWTPVWILLLWFGNRVPDECTLYALRMHINFWNQCKIYDRAWGNCLLSEISFPHMPMPSSRS
jgi:hypothetical protein